MGDFRMPSLGADMTQGKVVEWLVRPGDYVHRGDAIAEVDTEKTVMEVESFEEGVVAEFLVDLGQNVQVGTPIARITGTPADGASAGALDAQPVTAESAQVALEKPRRHVEHMAPPPAPAGVTPPVRRLAHQLDVDLARVHGTGRNGAITRHDVESAARLATAHLPGQPSTEHAPAPRPPRSSPRARRLAAEMGVDLAQVVGSGPGGAVISEDLEHRVPAQAPARPEPLATQTDDGSAATSADRVRKMHHAVGMLMAHSKRDIPHYYLSTTIDFAACADWIRRTNVDRPIAQRLVPAALLLAAAAKAARTVPDINGFFTDDAFQPSKAVHLGVAVALRGGGLIAPAIHDADTLTVEALMKRLRDVVSRARAGRLQRAEMSDPTITVTNLGDLGVESIFGVIYPPQVALIGFGRVLERPVAVGGLVGVHPTVVATLSADHRASDGLVGGRALALIDELLQNPETL
jgi:pyruvate dehydrogenase E2 component (dihydrolipoamide acetyltransferase)